MPYTAELAYYAAQGPLTDPGPYAPLYDALPRSLDGLCGVVSGLIVHDLWVGMGQLHIPGERKAEAEIRPAAGKLARILALDPSPLTEPRAFEKRLYGNCRDQALLLCSFLRHQGVPARVRKGFTPGPSAKKLDHAVCQVWDDDEARWRLVDVQMDHLVRERRRLPEDAQAYLLHLTPQDTPPETFITGGQAWLRCRAGEEDPADYGITGDDWGWFMVRHNLLRDLLALNKLELIPWDEIPGTWVTKDRSAPAPDQVDFLDRAAQAAAGPEVNYPAVRRLYDQTPQIFIPPERI